jgi:hypothetical protein
MRWLLRTLATMTLWMMTHSHTLEEGWINCLGFMAMYSLLCTNGERRLVQIARYSSMQCRASISVAIHQWVPQGFRAVLTGKSSERANTTVNRVKMLSTDVLTEDVLRMHRNLTQLNIELKTRFQDSKRHLTWLYWTVALWAVSETRLPEEALSVSAKYILSIQLFCTMDTFLDGLLFIKLSSKYLYLYFS